MALMEVKKLHTLTGHNDCIYTLEGGHVNNQFFSSSGDGMVVSWDLKDPEKGQLIAKLPNSVYALHYHQVTGLLIAGHNYEGIHLLDWQNKKETGSLKLSTAAIFDIRSLEGDSVLVASGDGTVYRVNVKTLTIEARAKYSEKSARTMAINPVTGEVAVGYSDNRIRILDYNLALKQEVVAHSNSVFTLQYTPGFDSLLSGSRDARLKLWDARNQYTMSTEVVAHMYAINHLDFSPDRKHFVTCSLDKTIKVWDTRELKLLKVIDRTRHGGHRTSVNKVLWTAHQDQLISASDDRTISVWHLIF